MSEKTLSNKRPIIATIIAVLLLVSTPFVMLNSIGFLKNPLQALKVFELMPQVADKILSQKVINVDARKFLEVMFENLKAEYSTQMNNPGSSLHKVEMYKALLQLIIAIATIFICIGLLQLKEKAYKFMLIRLLAALFIVVPLNYISARHMNKIVVSSMVKSLPQLKGQLNTKENDIEIIKTIVEKQARAQAKIPVIIMVVWYLVLIAYFLVPSVKKAFYR